MARTSDPLAQYAHITRVTPQNQRIPGRTDQVKNSAGGYVFAVDDWTRLHRFLIMGTTGGTYYISERELTKENAEIVFKLIAIDGIRVVNHVVKVSEAGDAPKQQPLIFALAVAASNGDLDTRRHALAMLPRVCRTGTMLFQFTTYVDSMRGWGRGLARGVGNWYLRDVEQVAYQVVKYRQRDGWTHRDVLRKSHPKLEKPFINEAEEAVDPDLSRRQLFDFICGRVQVRRDGMPQIVDDYLDVTADGCTVKRAAELARGLPWEALPDRFMNEPEVWDALLDKMPVGALIRQLSRLSRIGLIKPLGSLDPRIRRIADVEQLRKARVHPVAVLNALMGYKSGISKGGKTWTPAPVILDLLDDAFHASFGAIEPAGKRTMVALDISGSMWGGYGTGTIAGLEYLTPALGAAAMAMATVRTEPEVLVTAFAHRFEVLPITARHRLDDVDRIMREASTRMGPTDCSLPMLAAAAEKIDLDTFVVYTDNETWQGTIHPTQALRKYREASGIDAREAVVGMTSNGFSIADPTDAGQLDLVGFDAATPHLLSEFSRGNL